MTRLLRLSIVAALCVILAVGLAATVWDIARIPAPMNLPQLLSENLGSSGVEHPVTAVLLNFRSYDTLLEIGVMVIAGMVGICLSSTASLEDQGLRTTDTLVYALQRWFVPLMLTLSGYLLWAGSDRPGGAFQAGAVLAATGVMMRLGGIRMAFLRPGLMLRLGLALGFAVFLLVALAGAAVGDAFLAYPAAFNKPLIVMIETVLTLSIAMVLLALFVSAPINRADVPEADEST